jgi:hypothetical protein
MGGYMERHQPLNAGGLFAVGLFVVASLATDEMREVIALQIFGRWQGRPEHRTPKRMPLLRSHVLDDLG